MTVDDVDSGAGNNPTTVTNLWCRILDLDGCVF